MSERWIHLPLDRALAWESLSFYERCIGDAIFRLYQERQMQLAGGDWKQALARALGVSGRERPPFYKALVSIVGVGLLVVDGETIQLLYVETTVASQRTRTAGTPPAQSLHTDSTSTPQVDLTSGKDSGDAPALKEEINKEKEERAPARALEPSSIPVRDFSSTNDPRIEIDRARQAQTWLKNTIGVTYKTDHAEHGPMLAVIGGWPEETRVRVRATLLKELGKDAEKLRRIATPTHLVKYGGDFYAKGIVPGGRERDHIGSSPAACSSPAAIARDAANNPSWAQGAA